MLAYLRPRDLDAIAALAATAFVVLAVFAWTSNTAIADPNDIGHTDWGWKLWQVGSLALGIGGVWWLWQSTRRVGWVRSLGLAVLALMVLTNGYTGLFGDHWGAIWRTVNPLFIGSCSVSAVALWRCGCTAGKVGAAVPVILGAALFANAYFVNNGVLWLILDPVRMLTELVWAGVAHRVNVVAPTSTE